MTYYDIVGDIHGHAAALETLLEKLGYKKQQGYYRHARRKTVFVGDLIDRGKGRKSARHEILFVPQGCVKVFLEA